MSFDIKIKSLANPSTFSRAIVAEYSDILSLAPEYLLQMILSKIADKFVEEHYSEIEKQMDTKLIAAVVSASMGYAIEKEMMKEVERVNRLAQEALRRAKKR